MYGGGARPRPRPAGAAGGRDGALVRFHPTSMRDTKITAAALRSTLTGTSRNLALVRSAAEQARQDRSRMLFAPELQLTGHGDDTCRRRPLAACQPRSHHSPP
jgi:hypothetical protein